MAHPPDQPASNHNPNNTRPSSIPVRSIYLQPSQLPHTPFTANKPSTKFSLVKSKWKIDKLPAGYSRATPDASTPETDQEPPWTRIPTEEPLSPGLRAEVREALIVSYHLADMNDYRRQMKVSWFDPSWYLEIESKSTQFEAKMLYDMCNKVVPFYWMPQRERDGKALPLLPFGCLFEEWFKFHDNEPRIEFGNFFANCM
jgi:hypothetical protein